MKQSLLSLCIILVATAYPQIPKTLNYQCTLAARPSEAQSVAQGNRSAGRGTIGSSVTDGLVTVWGDALPPTATSHRWGGREFRGIALQGRPRPSVSPLFTQAQVYVVDTAVVRGTSDTTRHTYLYSSTGLVALDLTQQWSNEGWEDLWRYAYTYDAGGRMLSNLHELWRLGQWEYLDRYSYTYDVNGRMATRLWEQWRNGQQQIVDRITYTYDSGGNLLLALYEAWTGGQWVNSARSTYTYDSNGNMLTNLSENWTNGQWVNYDRYSYTRDANGRVLTRLYEQWANGQWINSQRLTSSYDGEGRPLTDVYEEWNYGWVPETKWKYAHDADGRMITRLAQVWNVNTGLWLDWLRITYTYDANGNMLMSLSENWTNVWVNSSRFVYTYDGIGNLTFAESEEWVSSSWVQADGILDVGDSVGNKYSYSGYSFSIMYRLMVTGLSGKRDASPVNYSLEQNYPNPFNPMTKIQFTIVNRQLTIVKVYDVLGREVATLVNEVKEPGTYTVTFDARLPGRQGSYLTSGVYFYRLQVRPLDSAIGRDSKSGAGDFVQTRKLLLLR